MATTEPTEVQDCLRVIYTALGYTVEEILWHSVNCRDEQGFYRPFPNPTDTDAGRAEFARLLIWAANEWYDIRLCIQPDAVCFTATTDCVDGFKATRDGKTPQEAFIKSLAAAIRARAAEKGEE